MDNNFKKIEELIDLLNKGEITPEELVSKISPGNNPLQSDDEIIAIGEEINKSLEPEKLVLTDDEINDILCKYEGEELGNRILWSVLEKLGLTRDLSEIPDFSNNDIFDNFFEKNKISDRLQRSKEMISDNLDLDLLGIKFKKSNLKIRNFKIAGFNFPLHVITHLGNPLFFHVPSPRLSVNKILDNLKIRSNRIKNKACENILQKTSINENELIKELENLLSQEKEYNGLGELAEDLFCEPLIPINPETGEPLFSQNDLVKFLEEICLPDPISTPVQNVELPNIEDISDQINSCLKSTKSIFNDIREKNEQRLRLQKAEKELEEILFHYIIVKNYQEELYNRFEKKKKSGKSNNSLNLTSSLILNSPSCNEFLASIKLFSSRFKNTTKIESSSYIGVSFNFQFPHGLGKSIEYERIKNDTNNELLSQDYQKVDITKLQLGMEFSGAGIFSGKDSNFLKNYKNILSIEDNNPKNRTEYFSFVNDVENTTKTKSQIINEIGNDHGFLYSNLIEVSANPWLFFTKEERGDNDSRKSAEIKPASTDSEGNPNPEFGLFWQDFKSSWDKKYNLRKIEIENKISEIKKLSDKFVDLLSDYYLTVNIDLSSDNSSFLKSISDEINKRVLLIEDYLLDIAQSISRIDNENSAESIVSRAESIPCAVSSQQISCPSDCCGPAGQNPFMSNNPDFYGSPDCPNLFTVCYWKEFSKNLNRVGILPIPSGLPPVEDPSGFLPNLGLRYWPVGYLPPSFIPLPPPIVNPLDGLPFIRIPMPMVWTRVDPIVIPIGIGVIVIFIPFIGGFMPSPLVYFHDFLTGNNIFLLGMRGFRFIPRKSDPVFNDPLEKYKQILSKGIPDYLFPFSNLGKDNIDSTSRILKEIKDNLEKKLSNHSKFPSMSKIQKIQDDITIKKSEINRKILEKKRRSALDGYDTKKESEELKTYLSSLEKDKINSVKSWITEYLNQAVDLPDIIFPKKSKNLASETPSSVKMSRNINVNKKLGIIPSDNTGSRKINLHSNILRGVDDVIFPTLSEYDEVNQKLSNDFKVVEKFDTVLRDVTKTNESLRKITSLITFGIGEILNGKKSPLSNKKLGLYKAKINLASRISGAGVPIPSSIEEVNDPRIALLKSYIQKNNLISSVINSSISNLAIGDNKILRQKDIRMLTKSVLNNILIEFSNSTADLKNFVIVDSANIESLVKSSSEFSTSLDLPKIPPKKSSSVISPLSPGGIPQITVSGKEISKFLIDGTVSILDSSVSELLPGGLDNFENLTSSDLKVISDNLIIKFIKNSKIPYLQNLPSIPFESRPQDYIEFVMNFLPTHPASDIAFTELWNKFKLPARIPIPGDILTSQLKIRDAIFSKIPWPIIVLIGRNGVNLLNPLWDREDVPRWDRMTLKNPFYVVFLDEFIRSATDISGGFKFFAGAGKLFYPLPDSEISLGFGTKISIN